MSDDDRSMDWALDPAIAEHYASGYEASRLDAGMGQLEAARTREILQRYLPPPPAVVVDVAAGAGAYAGWLAELGYQVHLRDVHPRHIELARERFAHASPPLASLAVGDARRVDLPTASVDGVLLMGPLYHLPERADRLLALREAHRLLRPGGVVVVAAISRFASLYDGLQSGRLADPEFRAIVAGDLVDGQHRNPLNHPDYFTTAYFHRPDDLLAEMADAGLTVQACLAVEGLAGLLGDFAGWWAEPERRAALMATLRAVEAEPSLLGASPHLLAIAHRPAP